MKDVFISLRTMVSVILELIRIIVLFLLLGAIGGLFVESIYTSFSTEPKYFWLGYIGILILIVVLYRNKLQFSGWYKGKGMKKLPKILSQMFIFSSIILLLLPPIISFIMSELIHK